LAISGVAGEDVPKIIADTGAECVSVDIDAITSEHKSARPNMIAVGLVMQMIGLAPKAVEQVIADRLSRKGPEAMQASLDAVRFGVDAATDLPSRYMLSKPADDIAERWVMSGNQAAGLGAIRGGVRFVAAYPITPATEILEWMSPRLPKVGGQLMQADGNFGSRFGINDRIDRIGGCIGSAHRNCRCHARRAIDRHPNEIGTGGPEHSGLWPARGCTPYCYRRPLNRRRGNDHAMVRRVGGSNANPGDIPLRPINRPGCCHHRPAGKSRLPGQPSAGG
jgi:hypothetical protein